MSSGTVTGAVLVTVKAASAADAEAIARRLANFVFDDYIGVLPDADGQFIFAGHASAPLSDSAIVSVCPDSEVGPFS